MMKILFIPFLGANQGEIYPSLTVFLKVKNTFISSNFGNLTNILNICENFNKQWVLSPELKVVWIARSHLTIGHRMVLINTFFVFPDLNIY